MVVVNSVKDSNTNDKLYDALQRELLFSTGTRRLFSRLNACADAAIEVLDHCRKSGLEAGSIDISSMHARWENRTKKQRRRAGAASM